MELLNYGMASSAEQQAVSTGQPVLANPGNMDQPSTEGVNDWLYETLQNGDRAAQNQEYVGVNNASANVNANPSPNPPINALEPNTNANANANVSASSTPAPAPVPFASEKAAHEDEQPENEPYSIVNTSTEQQPKRKQGRPPKEKTNDTSPVCVQMSDDTVVMPKRGRGRPPKNASGAAPPVVPPICIQVNEDMDAGAMPKRRPGRPPKAKTQATTLLTDFGEMLEDSEPVTVVTAKRRGRPPKNDEQSGEKRRRGRPPKAKTENGEPQAASRASATNGDSDMFRLESTSPEEDQFVFEGHSDSAEHERANLTVDAAQPKRGRGRPPKDKSATLGDAPKRSPPKQRSPPKPKRAPGEPPRKRGRPPKAAKLAENGAAAGVTKVQLESSAFDGAQPAGEVPFGENSAAVGGDTEVFGFGDMPAAASASANVTLNGATDSVKRKRGRPPKVKPAVEQVENE